MSAIENPDGATAPPAWAARPPVTLPTVVLSEAERYRTLSEALDAEVKQLRQKNEGLIAAGNMLGESLRRKSEIVERLQAGAGPDGEVRERLRADLNQRELVEAKERIKKLESEAADLGKRWADSDNRLKMFETGPPVHERRAVLNLLEVVYVLLDDITNDDSDHDDTEDLVLNVRRAAKSVELRLPVKSNGDTDRAPTLENESAEDESAEDESILDKAKRIVEGKRQATYGPPEDSFGTVAEFWTSFLLARGKLVRYEAVTGREAALMLALLKIAREGYSEKRDNLVDLAGYAACADMATPVDPEP